MTDNSNTSADETDEQNRDNDTLAVSSTYKILGELSASDGAGVLGKNTADSGTPIGVQGAVPTNSDGYGLATPNSARIERAIESPGGHTLTVDGTPTLELGPTVTDSRGNTAGGNVIAGYEGNGVLDGVAGATVSGGGSSGTTDFGTIPNRENINEVTGNNGTIGGGFNNRAGKQATAAGGFGNRAKSTNTAVGGGRRNIAGGSAATVGGGWKNTASGTDSTVGGGRKNESSGKASTVGGGELNIAESKHSTAGGGIHNVAGVENATVCGGANNDASGKYATVGGGRRNEAQAKYSTIAGGGPSQEDNPVSTKNVVHDKWGTIGGGGNNRAGSDNDDAEDGRGATVGGGLTNLATGPFATVAGGIGNGATAEKATVGGGNGNEASGVGATVAGGGDTLEGNTASGDYAAIPGGRDNEATGSDSLAAGRGASAAADGAFVWGDSTDQGITVDQNNQVKFQATGGMNVYTSTDFSDGVSLNSGGGSWSSISSRAAKTNVSPVEPRAVLEEVEDLAVSTWEYDSPEDATHMGPMAEEFYDAFGLGTDETRITNVDADGVALAAIQGLSAKLDEREDRIADLEERLASVEARLGTDQSPADD